MNTISIFPFRERQQQLDELSKELKRTQEESDMLRMKIKSLQKSTSKSVSRSVTTIELANNNKFVE